MEQELKALDALGVKWETDEEAQAQRILRLRLRIEQDNPHFATGIDQHLNLVVVFPDLYPFFRPEVFAADLNLPRHQGPFNKALCLIPRSTEFWGPETTLAEHLTSQLVKTIAKGMVTEEAIIKADPEEQAEPVSEYFPFAPEAPIIFDPACFDGILTEENEIAFLGKVKLGIPQVASLPGRMAVLESFNTAGEKIGKLPDAFDELFPRRLDCYIYRLSAPPPADHHQVTAWLEELLKGTDIKLPSSYSSFSVNKESTIKRVCGFTFPEEAAPGERGNGWLFHFLQ